MGTENNPQIGEDAALENIQTIKEATYGSHRVFIITGLGGGTGTGAAPVIAEICHKMKILTIAVVSKPFAFEGKKRMIHAEMGLKALRAAVDAVVIIPNDCIRSLVNKEAKALDMFTKVNEIIYRSVSDIILSGFSCMDFANMKSKSSKTGMVNLSGVRGVNLKFTTCVLLTLEEITEATI
jgi:cell division protein FtsZ